MCRKAVSEATKWQIIGTVACKSLETPTFFQFLTHNFSQTFSNNLKFLPNVLHIITIQNPFHKIFKTHQSINFYCFFEKASVQKLRNSVITRNCIRFL